MSLRPDHRISRVIKGGWQLAGGHGAVDRQAGIEDMIAFADAGITTFDCADIYTGVEAMIGDFRAEYERVRGAEALSQDQGAYEVRSGSRQSCNLSRADVSQRPSKPRLDA
jgi:aryl-alcohol dehydrogenase-like predicted oxidoreductase